MAVLANAAQGRRVTLGERCLVGRARICHLRLDTAAVSGEHATLFFSTDTWWVRDLGSTNGTFVDDERLTPGEKRALAPGTELRFGGTEDLVRWQLVDVSSPGVRARQVGGDAVRTGTMDLLCLPDDDDPVVSIFVGAPGEWMADFDGSPRPVVDHEVVHAGSSTWLLELPPAAETEHVATTLSSGDLARLLESCSLEFRVSSDEEHVDLTVHAGAEAIPLASRSHHYTLMTLARRRIADAARPGVPESEHGWVYADDLARELGTTRQKLNLDVCRARHQLAAAGIEGAGRLVERRATTHQLRIGISRLTVA